MIAQSSRRLSLTTHTATPAASVVKDSQQQARSRSTPVAVGDRLTLECARLGTDGQGICLAPGGYVTLTERALPGEVLELEVTQVTRGYAEARKLRTLSPHRGAVQPRCQHFGPCGGCTLQSLAYERQLAEKQNQVVQVLKRVGRLGDSVERVMLPPLGASAAQRGAGNLDNAGQQQALGVEAGPSPPTAAAAAAGCAGGVYEYRNKVQFAFSSRCWEPDPCTPSPSCGQVVDRPVVLGFLRPGSPDEVLPVVGAGCGCSLVDSSMNGIAETVLNQVSQLGLLPWNHPSGAGTLVHLVIRSGAGAQGITSSNVQASLAEAGTQLGSAPSPSLAFPQAASGTQALQAAAVAHADSTPDNTPGREYLVVINVTRQDTALLTELAEAVRAAHPEVVGVVSRTVAAPAPTSPLQGRKNGSARAGHKKQAQHKGSKIAQRERSAGRGGGQVRGSDEEGWENELGAGELATSQPVVTLSGQGYLTEPLLGLAFRISPTSFFQTNTGQAEVLYQAAGAAAALQPQDTLLDLYCGTGSIGLTLASKCKALVGYEVNEAAVKDARRNAALNGITNATFIVGNLEDGLKDPAKKSAGQNQGGDEAPSNKAAAKQAWLSPDVIIVDPARAGLSRAVRSYLLASTARRVVYVSCNPATQARDLSILCGASPEPGDSSSTTTTSHRAATARSSGGASGGQQTRGPQQQRWFKLESVQCVDLFPHTDHVETVVALTRQ